MNLEGTKNNSNKENNITNNIINITSNTNSNINNTSNINKNNKQCLYDKLSKDKIDDKFLLHSNNQIQNKLEIDNHLNKKTVMKNITLFNKSNVNLPRTKLSNISVGIGVGISSNMGNIIKSNISNRLEKSEQQEKLEKQQEIQEKQEKHNKKDKAKISLKHLPLPAPVQVQQGVETELILPCIK